MAGHIFCLVQASQSACFTADFHVLQRTCDLAVHAGPTSPGARRAGACLGAVTMDRVGISPRRGKILQKQFTQENNTFQSRSRKKSIKPKQQREIHWGIRRTESSQGPGTPLKGATLEVSGPCFMPRLLCLHGKGCSSWIHLVSKPQGPGIGPF